jgi:hypothetical protein
MAAIILADKTDTGQLTSLLLTAFEERDKDDVEAFYPEDLADLVFERLDPDGVSPFLVAWAAKLELRQLARQICAHRQETRERRAESGQIELFELQPRYPARRCTSDGTPRDAYVLRHCLSYWERKAVVNRLSREGHAKLRHGQALDVETEKLVKSGHLIIGPAPVELQSKEIVH